MPQISDNDTYRTWITPQHAVECCFVVITAHSDDKEIFIGVLGSSGDAYWTTWRGRLRTAWNALLGRCVHDDISILDKKHAVKLQNDLKEAIAFAYPEEQGDRYYGGNHLCNKCHRMVSNGGHECVKKESE